MDYFNYVDLPYLYGRLPVPGALDDMLRWCTRFIKGTYEEHYTHHMVTIDKHPPHTIHGNSWWADELGNSPDVGLPVQMELLNEAKAEFKAIFADGSELLMKPTTMRKWTVNYAKHLKATGQGNIWVFTSHCREETDGIVLLPAFAELLEWASVARKSQPIYLYKGMIAEVDWFGPFRPCMDVPNHPQGGIQTVYLDYIKTAKSTEITGQAKDFCVYAGTNQVMDYYGNEPNILKRIKFVNDCTSAIFPDDPKIKAFEKDMKDKGLQLIKHDDPF